MKTFDFRAVAQMAYEYMSTLAAHEGSSLSSFKSWLSSSFDSETLTKRHIYHACLDRAPEIEVARTEHYESVSELINHFLASLICEEFRQKIPHLVNKYFPDVRKTVFIHVPKTGGTGVRERLSSRFAGRVWDFSFVEEYAFRQLGEEWIIRYLAKLHESRYGEMFFCGHIKLNALVKSEYFTPDDRCFTVIRHPVDMILSCANYIMDCMLQEPGRPDSAHWAGWFEANGCGLDLTCEDTIRKSTEELIAMPQFKREYANLMTRYLGCDETPTLQSVCNNLVSANVTVVHIDGLDEHMRRTFDLSDEEYEHNAAPKRIKNIESVSWETRMYVYSQLCQMDLVLYEYLTTKMRYAGRKYLEPLLDSI